MHALAFEWLNLLVRWVHVIAAIMWIGDSFLFMWMDSSLTPPTRPREGSVAGELWMVHSGGFYEVVKRKVLAPSEMPGSLHWFKWQAYTTWISGFVLLAVTYWFGGSAWLVEAGDGGFSSGAAISISAGLLAAGWFVYDAIWMSPLGRRPRLASWLCFALFVLAALGLSHHFSGRAGFLLTGAMLGTVMAANVWLRIIPAQNQMLAATRAGTAVDASLGLRAKTRSIHNHYMTLPVLFMMLSNHYPMTWGTPWKGEVLVLVSVFGAALKHVMSFRARSHRGVLIAGAASLAIAIGLTFDGTRPPAVDPAAASAAPVAFSEVRAILDRRCITCHAKHPSNPSFAEPPAGVIFEDPERIHALAPRIQARAVVTRTMPLGNLTGMTDEERATLAAWIAQGARID